MLVLAWLIFQILAEEFLNSSQSKGAHGRAAISNGRWR
jgi:hypothetical protein